MLPSLAKRDFTDVIKVFQRTQIQLLSQQDTQRKDPDREIPGEHRGKSTDWSHEATSSHRLKEMNGHKQKIKWYGQKPKKRKAAGSPEAVREEEEVSTLEPL